MEIEFWERENGSVMVTINKWYHVEFVGNSAKEDAMEFIVNMVREGMMEK